MPPKDGCTATWLSEAQASTASRLRPHADAYSSMIPSVVSLAASRIDTSGSSTPGASHGVGISSPRRRPWNQRSSTQARCLTIPAIVMSVAGSRRAEAASQWNVGESSRRDRAVLVEPLDEGGELVRRLKVGMGRRGNRHLLSLAPSRPPCPATRSRQPQQAVDDGFFEAAQPIYARYGEAHRGPAAPPRDRVDPPVRQVLDADERFGHVAVRVWDWDQTYTAAEYRKLMLSYSGTQMMAPAARLGLLDDIEALIEQEFGGQITRPLVASLTSAVLR